MSGEVCSKPEKRDSEKETEPNEGLKVNFADAFRAGATFVVLIIVIVAGAILRILVLAAEIMTVIGQAQIGITVMNFLTSRVPTKVGIA